MTQLRYPDIFFDWGDTVMYDEPANPAPMVAWAEVRMVPGIDQVLAYLQASGRRISLATSASISNEAEIRAALARVNLDMYFERIFCFQNTGRLKSETFYRYILQQLQIQPSEALMVGDSLEKDVLTANRLGLRAVWFNPRTDEEHADDLAITVHNLQDLVTFFVHLDKENENE